MAGEASETLTRFGAPVLVGLTDDSFPATTVLTDGDYVVGSSNGGLAVSVFDALGDRLSGPVAVALASGGAGGGELQVTALSTGGFVTVTTDNTLDPGSASDLVAHVFDANGVLQSTFQLPTAFIGNHDDTYLPSVTALAGGGFSVVYEDADGGRAAEQFTAAKPVASGGGQTITRGADVYVQSFMPDGSGAFVSTTPVGASPVGQVYADGFFTDGFDQSLTRDAGKSIATLANGETVIGISDQSIHPYVDSYLNYWAGSDAVTAQILDADGAPVGGKVTAFDSFVPPGGHSYVGVEQGTGAPYQFVAYVENTTVTAAGSGFALLWEERDAPYPNGDTYEALHLRFYDASGNATTGNLALGLENVVDASGVAHVHNVQDAQAVQLADGSGIAMIFAQDRLGENHNQLYIATYGLDGAMTNAPILVIDNIDYSSGGSSNVQEPYDLKALPDGSILVTVEARDVGGVAEGTYTQLFSFAGPGVTVQNLAEGGQTAVLGAGANYLYGGAGDDTITAGTGASTIDGGAGSDLVLAGLGVTKVLSGGLGDDTLSFANATAGVSFALAQAGVQQATGGAGLVLASAFENVTGSAFADMISGDAAGNRIDAGAGDDRVVAGAGANILIGGAGADTLVGGAGSNAFLIGSAADSPTAAHDVIDSFHFGDVVDLSATGTTAVDVVVQGGVTDIYFSPTGAGSYAGLVEVHGDVAQGDVVAPGAAFVQNETLSALGSPAVLTATTVNKSPLAALTDGDTVTATAGPNGAYLLQVYSSTGVAIGAPITQTTYDPTSSGGQGDIRLAGLAGGGFVAVTADGSVNHGEGGDIVAHVYSADGVLQTQFVVDASFVANHPNEGDLSVAATPDGGFQVVWFDYDGTRGSQSFSTPDENPARGTTTTTRDADAFSQAFHVDASGTWSAATAANVQDNADGFFTNGGEQQSRSSQTENVAALANGDTVIVYHDTQWRPGNNGYFDNWQGSNAAVSQVLGPDGTPLTGKIVASDDYDSGHGDPSNISVAATADGYAVLWDERDFPTSNAYNEGLHIRFYDESGAALTGEIAVNPVQGVGSNGAASFADGDNLEATALADGSGLALVFEQDAKFEGHEQLYIETVDLHGHVITGPQQITDAVYGSGAYSVSTLATGVVQVDYNANVNGQETLGVAQFTLRGGSSGVASAAPGVTQVGTATGDALAGAATNDELAGLAGNDTLTGGAGSDVLNGGEGVDTATYAGFAHDYALTLSGGAGTVTGGPEGGVDRLSSIEDVQFLDGTLTFDPQSTAAEVVRLYDSFLGRAPDAAGFESYLRFVAAGHSFQDMADNAASSPEFANATAGLSDSQYVTYVYEHSLHREPDPGGLQTYVADLENGTFTRTSLIVQAAESPEHVALTAGVVAAGLWIPDEPVEGLELLYDASVQRQPDGAGLSGYGAELAQGTTFHQIADQMSQSAEFLAAHAGQTDAQFVDSLYVAEVGRHADPGGLAAYTAQLANGHTRGDVLYETAFSQEHQGHVLAYYDPLLGG